MNTPAARKATGSIAAVFADEPWLYSYDLPDDRDVTVKVEEVRHYPRVDLGGQKHTNVYGLKFVGKKKVLLLTAKATFKAMAKVGGKTFEDWVGKEIALYVAEVDAFGQTVDAIRIRTPKRGRSQAAQSASAFLGGGDDPGPGDPPAGFDDPPAAKPAVPGGELPFVDAFAQAVNVLGLTPDEARALLVEHDGDRVAAAHTLARRVDELNAREA